MVISFRLSGRRRRYHPPPPPASTHAAADDPGPHAAASPDGPPPPPRPPWEAAVSRIDMGSAGPPDVPARSEVDPVETELEPSSFALNLFPDGYSIGEPDKGLLSYLIGDDPKKTPYSRAPKALFSDIECGCLPLEILHRIPCKFLNGSTVCEVRDYRFFSNGGDYSGDDFPKVNRVPLRLGTQCVVTDLSSIVDASWTYHDQLIAESIVLNALQPRLNLDPTPCLELLCNSKKIDLGLSKARQQTKEKSPNISADAPENCKPDEFSICETATLCMEDEALEDMPSGKLNSTSVNCSSMIHVNNVKSVGPDPNYNIMNSSAFSDKVSDKESAASIASDHLFQDNEHPSQVAAFQVDHKNGQPQSVTVVVWKRKKSSNLLHGSHESKKSSSPNKTAMLNSQHSKGIHKSTSASNKKGLEMGTPKGIQVKVDPTVGDKDMKVRQQKPLLVQRSSNPCIDAIPEKVDLFNIRFKERCGAPIVNLCNSAMEDLKNSRGPSVTSFNACSREVASKPHEDKAATEPQHSASKKKISEISISLNQELKLKRKRQKNVNTLIKPPCENRSTEKIGVTGGVSRQLGIGLDSRREKSNDVSVPHVSTSATENYKPNEFNVCNGTATFIENAALEGVPSVRFNSSSVNYASSIPDKNVKSSVKSDPGNAIRSSSELTNSSAKDDRKRSASRTAPDHLFRSSEQKTQVQLQRMTVVQRKRKKSSKLQHEKHESKIHVPPRKTARLNSQNSICLQELTGTSNKERPDLGSPKEMQFKVKVDQATGNKNMEVQHKLPLPVLPTSPPRTSSNTSNPCIEIMPEMINSMCLRSKEGREAPVVDVNNSGEADCKASTIPSVNFFNAASGKASLKPHEDKPATEPQRAASKRKASETSTVSLNLETNSNGKQEKIDTQIKPSCDNRSSERPNKNRSSEETRATGGTTSPLGIFSDLRSHTEHPINTSEPDIEKILSEVILTTQRHGLNGRLAGNDGLETTCLLIPSDFCHQDNTEKDPYIREEPTSYYAIGGVTHSCNIRRIAFHPSQCYSCKGIVDESHYTLCLLESQAPDDHQITVGTIYGDEHMHIATLPTSCHAQKFVDQFILLMKRDGYNLCDDTVLTEPSELRQQVEDVSQLCYDTGEYAQYPVVSPSVANRLAINENNNIGCTFQNRLPDFHGNLLQQGTEQLLMTQQSRSLGSLEALFLNPSHSGGPQHTNRILQDLVPPFPRKAFTMDLHQFPSVHPSQEFSVDHYWQFSEVSFASNAFAMELHRAPSVQPSQEVSIDQYWQCRYDVPVFGDTHCASTSGSSYGQWRPVPTQLGSVVYQWDLPAFSRQIHNSSPVHDGRSIPWSEFQPIGSPQMSSRSMDSDDGSVTSTPVQLPTPFSFQYLSDGMC